VVADAELGVGGPSVGSWPLEVRLDAEQLGVPPLRRAEVIGPVVDRGESSQHRLLLHGIWFFEPLRQVIESINQTFKARLDLERRGGRTTARDRPRPAAHPDLRDLAQRQSRSTGPPVAYRLRSLTLEII